MFIANYLSRNAFASVKRMKGQRKLSINFIEVQAYVFDDMINLQFSIHNEVKLFLINPEYTFDTLREALKMETLKSVEIDVSTTSLALDENLTNYILNDKKNGPINIYIEDEIFVLTPAHQFSIAKIIGNQQKLEHSPPTIIDECIEKKIDHSHARSLSWFITNFNKQLSSQQSLSQTEIQTIFEKCIPILSSPIKSRINQLHHQKNIYNAEISKIMDEKTEMEQDAFKNAYLWITGIAGISVIQFGGFYYGIYILEDWGWNVCEPITYSIQCISALFALRFYLIHKSQRGHESILNAFLIRRMKQNRVWRDRLEHLNESLGVKQKQLHLVNQQINIYQNRINYDSYISALEKQQQLY